MEAILAALVITAPIIAVTTGVYLWGRRHSTPDLMRYRILQAALLVVAATAVLYVVLIVNGDGDAQTHTSQVLQGLGLLGVPFTYLANELRRTRKRLKP